MKTIVVGAIDKYTWPQIEIWYYSLRLTGFKGDIYMLYYDIDPVTVETLEKYGILLRACERRRPQVVIDRFFDLNMLLTEFQEEGWVVFADVGDIVFQTNPEDFLAKVPAGKKLVTVSEGIHFKDNRWTDKNLKDSFPEYYETMREQTVYNAGTIAAHTNTFSNLALEIYDMCCQVPEARSHDQAAFNILLQKDYLERAHLVTANGGWAHMAASSSFANTTDRGGYTEKFPTIHGGQCITNNILPCMFHHYTRHPVTDRQVKRRILSNWSKLEEKEKPNEHIAISDFVSQGRG